MLEDQRLYPKTAGTMHGKNLRLGLLAGLPAAEWLFTRRMYLVQSLYRRTDFSLTDIPYSTQPEGLI
jgi:hypothetical protein